MTLFQTLQELANDGKNVSEGIRTVVASAKTPGIDAFKNFKRRKKVTTRKVDGKTRKVHLLLLHHTFLKIRLQELALMAFVIGNKLSFNCLGSKHFKTLKSEFNVQIDEKSTLLKLMDPMYVVASQFAEETLHQCVGINCGIDMWTSAAKVHCFHLCIDHSHGILRRNI